MTPITADQMTRQDMEHFTQTHVCGTCGGILTVAWSANDNDYILRCGNNIEHHLTVVKKHRRKTEYELTHERANKEARHMDTTSLMKMDTNAMMRRVDMAKFPQDLTIPEKKLLAEVAITYGLDPLMGEVTIYQGRPFVSIDGRYRKAQDTDNLDGVETRPATKQEREEWQIPEGDYFFRSELWRKGSSRAFVGWGRVRKSETTGGKGFKPVETNPQRMAEKRAEAQALRKAFHIPLPSLEDIGINDSGRVVDVSTGEIIEAQARVLDDKPKAQDAPQTSEPPATGSGTAGEPEKAPTAQPGAQEKGKKRDPATIRNNTELLRAVSEDFGLTQKQLMAEAHIQSMSQIAEPDKVYQTIAAVYPKREASGG